MWIAGAVAGAVLVRQQGVEGGLDLIGSGGLLRRRVRDHADGVCRAAR
jgi:hypothetical protein